MSSFLDFLSANEMTVVTVLLVLIFLLIMMIVVIDVSTRKKSKSVNVINEENDIDIAYYKDEAANRGLGMVTSTDVFDELDVDAVTKNLEKTAELEEIKYVEEDEELEKTKALQELEALKRELAKIEEESNVIEQFIPTVNEQESIKPVMEPVVEIPKVEAVPVVDGSIDNINVTAPTGEEFIQEVNEVYSKPLTMEEEVDKFESEQEENAIISVEELEKASLTITDEEIERYEDDGNEPISIEELEALYKTASLSVEEVNTEAVESEEAKTISMPEFEIRVKPASEVYDDKNFKNTPVISPVYGINSSEANISLEKTGSFDKLNEEIKKTNEFLASLKELRKNLD